MPIRTGYILAHFRAPSETFITREIEALCGLGAEPAVFSIRGTPSRNAVRAGGKPGPVNLFFRDQLPPPSDGRTISDCLKAARAALIFETPGTRNCAATLRNTVTAVKFAREIDRLGITHLHAHFADVPATLAFMIQSIIPVRVTFSAHANDIWMHRRTLGKKIARADAVITCTRYNCETLTAQCLPGEAGKIHMVYHGTDLRLFDPVNASAEAPGTDVLAVGRLIPKKGFDVLLRACAILRARGSAVKCRIIGFGPEESMLRELVASLGLDDLVELPGYIPNEKLPAQYASASVLACPSVKDPSGDQDGLPNVILEAMAMRIPVVASDISGIPEAVRHRETGFLVPPGNPEALADAIQEALSNECMSASQTETGRQLVEDEFDYSKNTEAIYSVFKSL